MLFVLDVWKKKYPLYSVWFLISRSSVRSNPTHVNSEYHEAGDTPELKPQKKRHVAPDDLDKQFVPLIDLLHVVIVHTVENKGIHG